VFLQVFQMHVLGVLNAFRHMLQVLRLVISKVDQVLHLPPHFVLPRLGFSSFFRRQLGIRRRPTPTSCCW
jgi:hypothetical protein